MKKKLPAALVVVGAAILMASHEQLLAFHEQGWWVGTAGVGVASTWVISAGSSGEYENSINDAFNTWDSRTGVSRGGPGTVRNEVLDFGYTEWAAQAIPTRWGSNPLIVIQYNRYWMDGTTGGHATTYAYKRAVACHELGHAFNIAHQPGDSQSQCGVQHDWDVVNAVYGVPTPTPTPPPPTPTPTPPPQTCGFNNTCFSTLNKCLQSCCGVCERRINCGSATAHKCFE